MGSPAALAHVVQFTHIEKTFLLVNGCDGQVIMYCYCVSGESCVGQNQTSEKYEFRDHDEATCEFTFSKSDDDKHVKTRTKLANIRVTTNKN